MGDHSLHRVRSNAPLVVLFALVPAVLSGQPQHRFDNHVPEIVSKLAPVGRVSPDTRIDLILGLQPQNADQLDRMLRDVYDPTSPRYRQFITPSRYLEQFAPTAQ